MITKIISGGQTGADITALVRSEAKLHYWRTKAKEEVNLMVVTPQMLLPMEIKSDRT